MKIHTRIVLDTFVEVPDGTARLPSIEAVSEALQSAVRRNLSTPGAQLLVRSWQLGPNGGDFAPIVLDAECILVLPFRPQKVRRGKSESSVGV